MRGSNRPNVIPAKKQGTDSVGEYIEKTNNRFGKGWLKTHRARSTVGDLCDWCKKDVYVKRIALALRKKGWKFACRDCGNKNNLQPKRDKVWLEENSKAIDYTLNKNTWTKKN